MTRRAVACVSLFLAGAAGPSLAMGSTDTLLPFPIEFLLFAATLIGIALFHRRTLEIALSGTAAIILYKLATAGFHGGMGWSGFGLHLRDEWVQLVNLLGLLTGFALLSDHFARSRIPEELPRFLPDGWTGGFVLLIIVAILSSFLDNIAAAIIGGTTAGIVFRKRLHIGYIAAIVAASNAGGAGSVVGDTTTTMMWIAGISPVAVLPAYVASAVALVVFGIPAALQQQRYAPIIQDAPPGLRIDWVHVAIVLFILASAIAANVLVNLHWPERADAFPYIGAAVWLALLVSAPLRRPNFALLLPALRGSAFLLALVLSASLMPVEQLPAASWYSTLGLGFLSAVFDNIPLTALALEQGGYDWGMLSFAVGFGGSMIWFGSSAGVALSNLFPESRSVGAWLRGGWHVVLGYVLGFLALFWICGWHPDAG